MKKGLLTLALCAGLVSAAAADKPADKPAAKTTPISGSFKKGPAIGPQPELKGYIMTVRQERAVGSVEGGAFTGDAEYVTLSEVLDFKTGKGTFSMDIRIKKPKGLLVIALDGKTDGVTPEAKSVPVHGTWKVRRAEGSAAGMKGEGSFEGTEDFVSGTTTGTFKGATFPKS